MHGHWSASLPPHSRLPLWLLVASKGLQGLVGYLLGRGAVYVYEAAEVGEGALGALPAYGVAVLAAFVGHALLQAHEARQAQLAHVVRHRGQAQLQLVGEGLRR